MCWMDLHKRYRESRKSIGNLGACGFLELRSLIDKACNGGVRYTPVFPDALKVRVGWSNRTMAERRAGGPLGVNGGGKEGE